MIEHRIVAAVRATEASFSSQGNRLQIYAVCSCGKVFPTVNYGNDQFTLAEQHIAQNQGPWKEAKPVERS